MQINRETQGMRLLSPFFWYESLVETQNLASHEQPIANLIHPKNINIKHANKIGRRKILRLYFFPPTISINNPHHIITMRQPCCHRFLVYAYWCGLLGRRKILRLYFFPPTISINIPHHIITTRQPCCRCFFLQHAL